MSKPLIIIADTDELYLQNLERKFLEEFDDQIELEIISDPVYFEQRFETPVWKSWLFQKHYIQQDFKGITFPICVCWQKNMRVGVRRICL